MPTNALLKSWDCLPAFEAETCQTLINLYQASIFNVDYRNVEDAFIFAFGTVFGGKRFEAWKKLYGINVITVGQTTMIRTDSPSLVLVSNCQLYQGCQVVRQPCKFTNFFNKPT